MAKSKTTNTTKTPVANATPPLRKGESGYSKKTFSVRMHEATCKVHDFSKDVTKKMDTPRARKIRKRAFWAVLVLLIGAAVVVAYFVEGNDFGISRVYNFLVNSTGKMLSTLIAIVTVLIVMSLILLVLFLLSKGSKRRKTILTMVGSFTKYLSYIFMFGWILAIWGVNVTTILAGAGIIGLVIGLGAQSLISDILSGIFIVFENNIQVGDMVTFNGFRGEVYEIGIRTTKIKSPLGDVNVINNSELRNYVNMSKHNSNAISDITIEYGENLEKVERILTEGLPIIWKKLPAAVTAPKYVGPLEFSERGTVLRILTECIEPDRMQMIRDVNRELKLLFDKHKIKVAVPQVEVKK